MPATSKVVRIRADVLKRAIRWGLRQKSDLNPRGLDAKTSVEVLVLRGLKKGGK